MRDESVDLLRGLVMALMALDHVRDFFGDDLPRPTDLSVTTPALFFTRWITHFCAPTFVLLAGVGAALSLRGGRSRGSLSRFLLTRGLWLIFLELTVIQLGWSFDLTWSHTTLQVIWALGVSMVVLAGLLFLPVEAIVVLAIALVVGHNAFDGVHSEAPLWILLHHRASIAISTGRSIWVMYPVIPWVGVMACGYALGGRLARGERRGLVAGGIGMLLCFVILRGSGVYGDPQPWVVQSTFVKSVLAFLNCEKYPPSLDYLLMTLGPLLIALGRLKGAAPAWAQPLVILGRVPLFYYVVHLYLIHVTAEILFRASGWHSLRLGGVWLVWLAVVATLYPACRWFAGVKRRNPQMVWLSYL